MLVAEELEVDWKDIIIKQADAAPDFGIRNQRAAGSNAGAIAKTLLLKTAAET